MVPLPLLVFVTLLLFPPPLRLDVIVIMLMRSLSLRFNPLWLMVTVGLIGLVGLVGLVELVGLTGGSFISTPYITPPFPSARVLISVTRGFTLAHAAAAALCDSRRN